MFALQLLWLRNLAHRAPEIVVQAFRNTFAVPFLPFKRSSIEDNTGEKHIVPGLYFGPLTMNLVARPVLSAIGGAFFTGAIWVLVEIMVTATSVESPLDLPLYQMLWLAFTILFALGEESVEEVPIAHAAMLTFLGFRIRMYRTEGRYSWTGKRLGLDRSRKVAEPGTDKDGLIYLGEIQIPIWNSAAEKDKIRLSNTARDSSTVYANLLIVLSLSDPYLWIDSKDPLTDIAERARSAFRTGIAYFIGVDNAIVKSVLGKLMSGFTMVTAFLRRNVGGQPQGSVLRDMGGAHIHKLVPPGDIDEVHERDEFRREIESVAHTIDPDLLAAVKGTDGRIVIETRAVAETLNEVMQRVGAILMRASVGDIALSEEVIGAANKAASEAAQRAAQLASAETMVAARKILAPTAEEADRPQSELAALIAAAQDNPNIKIVMIPGADPLTRAAVAAATQIRSEK